MSNSGGDINLSDEQQRIVDDFGGNQFVSAGAGSGKTRVVIEGIVSALEKGEVSVDQVLAITFTDKAAGQMVKRARKRLTARGMQVERRQIESAQISTIHSFCSSLIRANALALGLDPQFSVADEAHAALLKEKAFTRCLEGFITEHGDAAVELYSDYDPRRAGDLGEVIIKLHDELRSRGHERPDIDISRVDKESIREDFRETITRALDVFERSTSKSVENVRVPLLQLLEAIDEPDQQESLRMVFEAWPYAYGIKEYVDDLRLIRKQYMGALCLDKLELLRELLLAFTEEYTAAKRTAALLDFEDLQLQALTLLRSNERLCDRIASRFRIIVVDEFQDTNGLQYEIVELLARENVCFVGDENQSIYRFRHADVGLFREKREQFTARGRGRPLSINYRSQPEILTFVNHIFGAEGMLGGNEYLRMESGAVEDRNGDTTRVETIIVDSGSNNGKTVPVDITRQAEAALVARRLAELFNSDLGYEPGGSVILVRTRRGAEFFSEAMDRIGIPNYLSIGNDYYRKLELGDALGLLRLLVNPLDDIALLSVLRSPLVGLDDDTLIGLRRSSDPGTVGAVAPPIWPTAVSKQSLDNMPGGQADRLASFIGEYGEMRRRSRRQSLESTVRDVIGYRDYAAIAAAGGDGRTSIANLMKLIDLAVAYEESWGRDFPSFVDFLVHQQDKQIKESEAPTEEEGSTAVQIMTIHSAKGLEFPLVVWGYMGVRPKSFSDKIVIGKEGGIGFRYTAPAASRNGDDQLLDYETINDMDKRMDLEEKKRVGYVAMTRAERHLILCGHADCLKEPGGLDSKIPMDWVRRLLELGPDNKALSELVTGDSVVASARLDSVDECPIRLMVCNDPEAFIEEVAADAQSQSDAEPPVLPDNLGEMPADASFVPAYINASSISKYRKCPRRYYLENQLHANRDDGEKIGAAGPAGINGDAGHEVVRDGDTAVGGSAPEGSAPGGLPGNLMGTLVHNALERAAFSPEISIDTSIEHLNTIAAEIFGGQVELTETDYERATHLLESFRRAPVAGAMSEADAHGDLRREQRFLTMLGETTILSGTMDVFCRTGAGVLVVDYKTDRIDDSTELREAADHHAGQMAAYALAASRMQPDTPVQVVLLFLDQPGEQVTRTYQAEGLEKIERELQENITSMADGLFPPLPAIDRNFCPGCAGFTGEHPLCATGSLRHYK